MGTITGTTTRITMIDLKDENTVRFIKQITIG